MYKFLSSEHLRSMIHPYCYKFHNYFVSYSCVIWYWPPFVPNLPFCALIYLQHDFLCIFIGVLLDILPAEIFDGLTSVYFVIEMLVPQECTVTMARNAFANTNLEFKFKCLSQVIPYHFVFKNR